jgi:hypothetical protein
MNDGQGTETDSPDFLAWRLEVVASVLKRFAHDHRLADPADTSPEERERLVRATELVNEAVELFW